MPQYDEEQELIKLLKKLPRIEDSRSIEEVYRGIRPERKRRNGWHIAVPAFTLLAAASLFLIMFFSQPPDAEQDVATLHHAAKREMPKEEAKSMADAAPDNSVAVKNKEEKPEDTKEPAGMLGVAQKPETTAIYRAGMSSGQLVTLGVITGDAIVLPVSMVVPDEKMGWIDAYKEAAVNVVRNHPEFSDPTPLLESLKEEEGKLDVVIDPEHQEYFSRNQKLILPMLGYMLKGKGIGMVEFKDEEGNPVELGDYGIKPDPIQDELRKAYYSYTPPGSEVAYLIPADLPSESLKEAVASMKVPPNDFYKSVISDEIGVEVEERENEAILQFNEELNLAETDEINSMRLIEGLLLTAREFGYRQVKFDNIKPENWGPFNFEKPVDVPEAPNEIAFK